MSNFNAFPRHTILTEITAFKLEKTFSGVSRLSKKLPIKYFDKRYNFIVIIHFSEVELKTL